MSSRVRAVVDASTIAKWVLDDEDLRDGALALLDDSVRHGRLELTAPSLAWYELIALLMRAERRQRASPSQINLALAYLLELDITLHEADPVPALAAARMLGISGYDAAYVALAADLGIDLWTADRRLVDASAGLGFVRWIGEYVPA